MSSLFKGESKIGSWEFVIKNRKSKSGGFLADFPQKSIGKHYQFPGTIRRRQSLVLELKESVSLTCEQDPRWGKSANNNRSERSVY